MAVGPLWFDAVEDADGNRRERSLRRMEFGSQKASLELPARTADRVR